MILANSMMVNRSPREPFSPRNFRVVTADDGEHEVTLAACFPNLESAVYDLVPPC